VIILIKMVTKGRVCRKCGKRFSPSGRYCHVCEECIDADWDKRYPNRFRLRKGIFKHKTKSQ